ncbi:hypothetical protein FJ959_09015 [Mesorhizobium sp. B2-2-4]|uniref:hypothetical protein n=1 Tax=unclassified Mesorhizobium TaxID=325217 RepID=UPI00112CCF69|nr:MULTISPECIES: hypothetical protein [unclassified Mesorhizobium]TPM59004.1 hypothetical protein FJ959_09015 [Mesorhizobium sp. B2-2-4]TPM67489.1 hypothetical protein FJ965_10155 [Mesorhizobium sp. B2-2-1]
MDEDVYQLLCRAWDELRAGNYDEVDLMLERIINRKWGDVTECDGQYRMFDADAKIDPTRNFFANALGMQVAVHCGEAA